MENQNQASTTGKGNTTNQVLIGILIKLCECENEFLEQAKIIGERNPTATYDDYENKFYSGLGGCLSAVEFFIGEWAIRAVYKEMEPEPTPNTITFETK
ncbi:hypothetical protein EZS27_021380 [termite gut metagenome]|uniref:Uncharacterized protein n=1 Tax=termite gut metagenome TaxID=433724 RepID=A0A5J4R854_9ZZZZ